MAIKADIRFRDGSVHRCIGRIVNGNSVPFTDAEDVRKHVASIFGLELIKLIIEE